MNRYFTLMVVPDRSSHVRRYRVATRVVVALLVVGLAFAGGIAGASVHYGRIIGRAAEATKLREENVSLKEQLQLVAEKVASLDQQLERVERFDQKLRAITALSDPERNLAIGPLGRPDGSPDPRSTSAIAAIAGANIGTGGPAPVEELEDRLEQLVGEATRNERSLSELHRYFEDQKNLLASTPSIFPARGWMTSEFGSRSDPYTGESTAHHGIDIANAVGTPIVAPADGLVVFASMEGGYGKVLVLDHGYGVKTRYAHLSDFHTKVGEKVRRGQKVGALGNTGRSTGPHLHYEVRVNGIPENPLKYVLE